MKKRWWRLVVVVAALGVAILCVAGWAAQRPVGQAAVAAAGNVQRGQYLVENVAMCGECHTPRDSQGQIDNARWLEGAPMWFTPVVSQPDWAYRAPALAGLPSFTDADMSMILEKGLQPTGRPIRPPMHVFHMTHEDTMAVIAYLRSLPAATN
jgi:hypothetical protein